MSEKITCPIFCSMVNAAAEQIRARCDFLSQLDSAVGDGDHGTTIQRAMEAARKAAAEHSTDDLRPLLSDVAWAIMGCDGGSTGPLLGSFFLGMSEGAGDLKEFDCPAFTCSFQSGVAKMQKQSRAQIGDKTMMDAFLPALAALQAAAPANGVATAMRQAAEAAATGAEATRNMRAKFGRARNLGDRVIGHADPGAVSVSLILKGFSLAL